MQSSSGISIVIPAYNEERFLPPTLQALRKAADEFQDEFKRPCEIIVCDNMSTDRTCDVARGFGARVVQHAERNIAGVRNAGIRAAAYDVIVTVDADNLVPPHALRDIWEVMQSGHYVGGGVRVEVASKQLWKRILVFSADRAILYGGGLSLGMFFFLKADAEKFRGFPEQLLVGEDSGFAVRLKRHGRKDGRRYKHLHSVSLKISDRKKVTFRQGLKTVWHVFRQLLGRPTTQEQLEFWYHPDR